MELLDGFCPSFLKTNPVLADGVYGALTCKGATAVEVKVRLLHWYSIVGDSLAR